MGGATAGGINHFKAGRPKLDTCQAAADISRRCGNPSAVSMLKERRGMMLNWCAFACAPSSGSLRNGQFDMEQTVVVSLRRNSSLLNDLVLLLECP